MAEDFIRRRVAMGFDDADEIHGTALDYLDGTCEFNVLEPYLDQLTRDLVIEHCEAQMSWPAETDCDRLDFAFLVLEEPDGGLPAIVARHNFTRCQSDGQAEIWREVRDAQQRGPVMGYTFYHEQDTERAVEDGHLYLSHGALEDDEDAARDVAHRIVQVLREAGLAAEWSSDMDQRILVCVDWRKRREDCH